ncbi:MAG: ADP/ATP carrier protein [Cytophagales bacterium]|nr:ADP/ATP carrier protein [Cytophagales bacterium]
MTSTIITEEKPKFGKWRQLLFPIYMHELKKLVPSALVFLCISFNYSLLRGLKDVYVYNTMTSSSIYALKVLVMPSVILFTIAYTFIAKRVNRDVRFNIVIAYFLVFFFLFYTVLLPNCDSLQLLGLSTYLSNELPMYFHWWDCIRVWPVSLFYIHAEIWGTLVLGVSYWTFMNEIISSAEANRVYPFLMVGAGVGGILSGIFLFFFSAHSDLQIEVVLCLILCILSFYNILARNIAKDPAGYNIEPKIKKPKVRLSFLQSIKFLLTSRYLLLLTCIVFGYNMFIVFLESVWKGRVGVYSDFLKNDYLEHYKSATEALAKAYSKQTISKIYGLQSFLTGVFSLFWIFFVSGSVSKKKWKFTALFTPVLALVSSLMFYMLYTFRDVWGAHCDKGTSLYLIVIFGLIILCFIKSSKYVFFDTSKERAYIPLDEESKTNGKAAIDAIGSRLAKGISAVSISGILVPKFDGLDQIVNISFSLVSVLIVLWILAVLALSPEYEKLNAKESADKSKAS